MEKDIKNQNIPEQSNNSEIPKSSPEENLVDIPATNSEDTSQIADEIAQSMNELSDEEYFAVDDATDNQEENSEETPEGETGKTGKKKKEKKVKPKKIKTADTKKRNIGFITMAVGIIAFLISPMLSNIQVGQYRKAYQMLVDVNAGTQITSTMYSEISIPSNDDVNSLKLFNESPSGCYAQADIKAGDIATDFNVGVNTPTKQTYIYNIPEGKQVMAIPTTSFYASVAGYIQTGDVISFYGKAASGENKNIARELQYIEVKDVLYNTDENGNKSINAIVLVLTDRQVMKIINMQDNGGYYLTIANRSDATRKAKLLQEQETYLEQQANKATMDAAEQALDDRIENQTQNNNTSATQPVNNQASTPINNKPSAAN